MAFIDVDVLAGVVVRVPNYSALTPAERTELIRIAQGLAGKVSAAAAQVSAHTMRERRRHICRKLGVAGVGELVSALLALSLDTLATKASDGHPRPEKIIASDLRVPG